MVNGLEIYEREKYLPGASGKLVQEPLDWNEVLERVPESRIPQAEIIVAYRGRLYSLDQPGAPRWRWMPKVLFGEGTGRSRAFKTRSLLNAARKLQQEGVGVMIQRERPKGLIADFSPLKYNYAMALGSALSLSDAREAFQRGGWYSQAPNLWIADRGPASAHMFDKIYKKYGAGDPIVNKITRRHIRNLDFILHFRISTNVALQRGSRMTKQMQDEIGWQHDRLPDMVAEITRGIHHPIVIATIDASGPISTVKAATLKTLGSIVRGMKGE